MHAAGHSRGYTIVEVMIFLAVSGFMFVIAAAFVSGKQSNAEFRQGMNDVTSQIQQVVNNVANGHYPYGNNFTCTPSATAGGLTFASGGNGQGTSAGCIFLGQVIQFAPQDSSGSTNDTAYNVYTVAGNRCALVSGSAPTDCPTGSHNVSTSFAEAKPTAVYPTGSSTVDLTQRSTLQWGMQVTGVYGSVTATAPTCTFSWVDTRGRSGGPTNCSAGFKNLWQALGGTWANGATLHLGSRTFTLSITGSGSGSGTPITAIGFFGTFGGYDSSNTLTSGSQAVNVVPLTVGSASGGSDLGQKEADAVTAISGITDSSVVSQPNIVICLQNGSHKGSVTIGSSGGQRLTVNEQFNANGVCP